jgi:sugar phosphate isomerase/epimerase
MSPTRRDVLAALPALTLPRTAVADEPRPGLGVVLYSYSIRSQAEKAAGFAEPLKLAAFCKERGATAVQLSLGKLDDAAADKLRSGAADLGVALEGTISPPADAADLSRFEAEVRTAARAGAAVLRTALMGGRRYEVFKAAAGYTAYRERAGRALRLAEPVVAKHKVVLAVENHKDFRTGELLDLLRGFKSEHLGVCLDTGNNIALLEDALDVVNALAPFAATCHLKDMGVRESPDGFLLSEVPLGTGSLDLKLIVTTIRTARPKARFQLEMITRDPLRIPCLAEPYWATMGTVSGRELARTLAWVRKHAAPGDLPRVSTLPPDARLKVEDENVRLSFRYARDHLGL